MSRCSPIDNEIFAFTLMISVLIYWIISSFFLLHSPFPSTSKQMGQTPRLIMIQWCVSLLLLYIVFVIGIDQTQSPTACTAVAALLHYFTLSSVLWMGIEGVNLYILLVRVMDVPRTRRFMPIACLVAWGNISRYFFFFFFWFLFFFLFYTFLKFYIREYV